MSRTAVALFSAFWAGALGAQEVIPLWDDGEMPNARSHSVEEVLDENCWGGVPCVLRIVTPTLTLYRPEVASNGAAVVILPGGGYQAEAVFHEGYEIAERLAASGAVAAVLKYRLPDPETASEPWRVPEIDTRRALRILRERQAEFGFTASRFGVLGFSAGGHLAASVSVHRSNNESENPDFSILVYGVTLMNDANREWLEDTLYHRPMTEQEVEYQALTDRVGAATPPAFLVHAFDDDVVPYEQSTRYAEALERHDVDAEVHLFARGGHGFGPGREEDGTAQWLDLLGDWLDRQAAGTN